VQTILTPHEQRRRRIAVGSSKLSSLTFHAGARLPSHVQAACHFPTTNKARKKTHPLNSEKLATQVTGEKPFRAFSYLKQANAKCAKLLQRANFESYLRAGIRGCCNQVLSLTSQVGVLARVPRVAIDAPLREK
jgi:hypothetical protein